MHQTETSSHRSARKTRVIVFSSSWKVALRCFSLVSFSERDQIFSTAERVRSDVGEVDIVINNAGIVQGKRLMDTSDETIMKTFQVNLFAHFWVSAVAKGNSVGSLPVEVWRRQDKK